MLILSHDEVMSEQKSNPSLLVRVLQGVVLGAVLAIPVVLWGLSRVEASHMAGSGSETAPPAAARPAPRPRPTAAAPRRPQASTPEVETIPASQMHLRIDDGSRPASPPPPQQQSSSSGAASHAGSREQVE